MHFFGKFCGSSKCNFVLFYTALSMRLEIRHRLCLALAQQSMCLQQVCHMSVALKPSA